MFDKVLNMPLHYLCCFVLVLREIHGKVHICETDYSINSKLSVFPSHTWNYNIQANERLTLFRLGGHNVPTLKFKSLTFFVEKIFEWKFVTFPNFYFSLYIRKKI